MKFLKKALTILAALSAMALGEAQAGVSISVGEPGFYGRVDIGNAPAPRLIYGEPVIVRRVKTWYPPIYLRVPPGHVKNWYRHCDEYDACGRPVYFVDDDWYEEVYVPRYREHHRPVYVPAGPPPSYYEYRKYHHKPPKKVYIKEEYYEDGRRYRDDDPRDHGYHHR
jgi:hypothetical protein